jgi:DNA repair protein RadC
MEKTKQVLILTGVKNNMNQLKEHTDSFLKGIISLTGLSFRKVQLYARENNPVNILEHPHTLQPNEKQLLKIGQLNELISAYSLLKMCEGENKIGLTSSSKAGEYFVSLLGGTKDKERFLVAFMDNSNNVIETRTMSEGTIEQAPVFPREILKAAIACDCKSMILAHNHPGCTTHPSLEDQKLTQRLVDIFNPLEINILDHIIVAGTTYCSMAEKGCLPQTNVATASYQPVHLEKISSNEVSAQFENGIEREEGFELEL